MKNLLLHVALVPIISLLYYAVLVLTGITNEVFVIALMFPGFLLFALGSSVIEHITGQS
ncbi:hypothetical protein LCGC14_0146420 [marine sediment metagenome]|uniref:Uncharacterized protein n=1 Tax=marine sediment metagenome TaxID=412755 RepID=A0A0F9XHJ5_9ZZZZ